MIYGHFKFSLKVLSSFFACVNGPYFISVRTLEI